ncbi:MAG: hypothetical protein K1060chlam5_01252 [Candidatus Anoxychlamydiales bacterium]|nr:hypothetical protein [Candidatus Anoxychlamydiales bacterium]
MYPLHFVVQAEASYGISNKWQSFVKEYPKIEIAIPPEFNGPGKAYSPEDLYALAVLNCIIAVYKSICEKNDLKFEKLLGSIDVTMDKSAENSHIVLTHLDISITVKGASDTEKARELFDKAMKTCPVSNSIKSGKTCHFKTE